MTNETNINGLLSEQQRRIVRFSDQICRLKDGSAVTMAWSDPVFHIIGVTPVETAKIFAAAARGPFCTTGTTPPVMQLRFGEAIFDLAID